MANTPAGWYKSDDGEIRWWDGSQWTPHTQPREPASEEARTSQASGQAVASPMNLAAKGHNGTLHFDDDFITIQRKGALARMSVGKGDKRIPIASVTSVQWKPPGLAMNGFISFSLAGGNEKQSRFGSQTSSAAHDENSVIVTKGQAPAFIALREAIESAIAARSRPAQPVIQQVATPTQAASPMEQLKQLADLHAAGIVSDEEFAEKKAELLARM